MLQLYFDILDKYFSRQDNDLCYMDTDSFYLAMSGDSLNEIVKPKIKQAYKAEKKYWVAIENISKKTPTVIFIKS